MHFSSQFVTNLSNKRSNSSTSDANIDRIAAISAAGGPRRTTSDAAAATTAAAIAAAGGNNVHHATSADAAGVASASKTRNKPRRSTPTTSLTSSVAPRRRSAPTSRAASVSEARDQPRHSTPVSLASFVQQTGKVASKFFVLNCRSPNKRDKSDDRERNTLVIREETNAKNTKAKKPKAVVNSDEDEEVVEVAIQASLDYEAGDDHDMKPPHKPTEEVIFVDPENIDPANLPDHERIAFLEQMDGEGLLGVQYEKAVDELGVPKDAAAAGSGTNQRRSGLRRAQASLVRFFKGSAAQDEEPVVTAPGNDPVEPQGNSVAVSTN